MPGVCPLTAQNFLNSMQFFTKFGKIICWHPPWRVAAPSYGESWIRPFFMQLPICFSERNPCSNLACIPYCDLYPTTITAEEILKSEKVFTTHCVTEEKYYNKSHFYAVDCSAVTISDFAAGTVQACKDKENSSGRMYMHIILSNGSHLHRHSYNAEWGKFVGYFVHNGERYHQRSICVVFENNRIIAVYPTGLGWPKNGGPPIEFPFKDQQH